MTLRAMRIWTLTQGSVIVRVKVDAPPRCRVEWRILWKVLEGYNRQGFGREATSFISELESLGA